MNALPLAVVFGALALAPVSQSATRIKELAAIEGVRDNQLLGYGLVVGLNGTGDKRQTFFSAQSLANVLDRMGVQVSASAIQVRNTAAVMLTANLPPYAQPGTRIDVQASAIGDATNLQGGTLILTPLKAASGEVYAVAQGAVVTGGFVAGRGGNSTTVNHPTAGRIPNGGIVEHAPPSLTPGARIKLQLRMADFTTSARLAAVVNKKFGDGTAQCESAGVVSVAIPPDWVRKPVEFVAEVEGLTLEADRPSRIIINERTGTITAGQDIRIRPATILHGNLSIAVQTNLDVSQPQPFSQGRTTVTPSIAVAAKEEPAKDIQLKNGATVNDLVRALTAVGSTPRDIIAILQNLKAAGALDAEIEVL
ncbi:flagellar basal body P-ring protein FlgI [uncultured Paludibaculum sp.]|uniref:flagellar basal body P-ring protein FlgI n=1 Tax=uncultured Paludibaculum sp. TaxID=1765020 RepID=UPI002AAB7514|nr:flagellar basal body P-ring protein FlgI [uncultured Paludibaculum sp.]